MSTTEHYLKMAVDLARQNADSGGRPFASVIVKDGKVVATAVNNVAATGDPTAHAETEAIRAAAKTLKSEQLHGCVLYASGHPCPMCLAANWSALTPASGPATPWSHGFTHVSHVISI